MRILFLIILALVSTSVKSQDTTWLKASQLGYDRASLHPKLISNRILSSCNVKNGGGTWSNIFSEYNRNGDLINKRFLLRQYFEYGVSDWMEFKNKNILVIGDGVTPTSQANVVQFTALYDSNETRIMALEKDSSFTQIIQKNDTSFYAVDNLDTLRLGYYNSNGKTIWKKSIIEIIGLPKNDSLKNYKLKSLKSYKNHFNILFQLNDNESYWLTKCNNSGIKIKSDTFKIDGFIDYSEIWNGFVITSKTNSSVGEIQYLDSTFNVQWKQPFKAEKEIKLHSLFTNSMNEIMVSVQYSHFDSTKVFKGTTYFTRIYSFDVSGNEKNVYEYKIQNFAIQAGVNTQFSDGGYLMYFGFYGHLAQDGGAEMGRTNSKGEIHDSAWIGYPIFPDVSIKDTNSSTLEKKSFKSYLVFPNPTTSTLTISVQSNHDLSYSLFDLDGQRILSGDFNTKIQLDVSELNRGMYFLRIEDIKGGSVVTRKVIIE
jgi:hypothetical protein